MIASETRSTRDRALDVARDIGERLLIETAAADWCDLNTEHYPTRRMNGTVGFALCFLALAHATGDERYVVAMHRELARATRANGPEPGLFSGFAGLAAVAHLATEIDARYERTVARCFDATDACEGVDEDDLFFGRAGIRIAGRLAGAPQRPVAANALRDSLFHPERVRVLGLAHGLPGMMTALVMCEDDLPEHVAASALAISRVIAASARRQRGAFVWPRFADDPPEEACRSVWCNGTPGVAISLLQVAQRIFDSTTEAFARDALLQLANLPREELLLGQFGVCHGRMGNALVYHVAAKLTGDDRFQRICDSYVEETLSAFEYLGPRTLTRGRDGNYYDAIGHLNGISGVALALLTIHGLFSTRWLALHALFL